MSHISRMNNQYKPGSFGFKFLPTMVVFVVLMIITVAVWNTSEGGLATDQVDLLQRANNTRSSVISQRLSSFSTLLEGGAGLFNASDNVTQAEWNTYFKAYHIQEEFPGLESVGYAPLVTSLDTPSQQPTAIIQYLEPTNSKNQGAIGYNMYTDATRRSAMNLAATSGRIAMSNLTTLPHESGETTGKPGFMLFMPVYIHDANLSTAESRQNAVLGYVFSPVHVSNIVSYSTTPMDSNYGFQLYSTETHPNTLAYQSDNFTKLVSDKHTHTQSFPIQYASRKWELVGVVSPNIVSASSRNRPNLILYGGVVFSIITSLIVYLLFLNRSQYIDSEEEKSLQAAKDELLALASHQLRTPATGVKQYVGMLREGFAGKLSPLQKRLLDKAYASNERQLGTINEMLFVARSDSNNLRMDKSKINLNTMVQEITDEQAGSISQRKQQLRLRLPKGIVWVIGDEQYLRMAFENIVSNASKYTPDNGEIFVTLYNKSAQAVFIVQDTGVGVSKSDQPMLFKKFSRIHNELTTSVSGSGIGLYLAKKVIDSHGGSIALESDGKKGSVVTIQLPKNNAFSHS